MIKKRILFGFIIILFFCFLGCASPSKQSEMERVAKDWALTIRAGQVIPVYPLTADLQPGDIFLVQTPISKETEIYHEKGYLALDLLYARLKLNNEYKNFYSDSYWKGSFAKIPFDRPKRNSSANMPDNDMVIPAPSVAFPNYTFNVNSGGGLQVAIPINSVPVGLGIMGTNAATGSVELNEAFTYGLSVEEIIPNLKAWSVQNKVDLCRMVKSTEDQIFLRIVNRIFMVGGLTVSLSNADSKSSGLDIAAVKPIDFLSMETDDPVKIEQTAVAYKKATEVYKSSLNDLTESLPGGSIRIAQASRRSITLIETFKEPKAIGYHGFDVPINEDGSIGPVITTFHKLESNVKPPVSVPYDRDENTDTIKDWLESESKNRERLQSWLDEKNLTISITAIRYGAYPDIRKLIVKELIEKSN